MKTFNINSKSGTNFEIGINEEPQVRECASGYTKDLKIISLRIDGIEVHTDKDGRLFLVEFGHTHVDGQRRLVVEVKYDAFKFIKKLKNIPGKQEGASILCSPELADYYNNVFLPAAETKIEQLKVEKAAALQAAFNALTDNSILDITFHTSYGYSVRGEYSEHKWFEKCFSDLKRTNTKIPNSFITNCDWGDYSITEYYKITFDELKRLYQTACEIIDAEAAKAAQMDVARQAKFDEAKSAGAPVELERYLAPCNDPHEECDMDIVVVYAMPDGTTKTNRNHTW